MLDPFCWILGTHSKEMASTDVNKVELCLDNRMRIRITVILQGVGLPMAAWAEH